MYIIYYLGNKIIDVYRIYFSYNLKNILKMIISANTQDWKIFKTCVTNKSLEIVKAWNCKENDDAGYF